MIQMPLNAQRIQAMMKAAGVQSGGQAALGIAQRKVLQNAGAATALTPAQKRGRVAFRDAIARRQTGQVDPTTGQTIDPTTGQPIAGATVDPTTGQTIDPATGQPIQAATGQTQAGTATTNPVASTLLLEGTFTPITANVVLDSVNMRLAFPVNQLDGEYILTMKTGAAGAAAPATNGTAAAKMRRQDPAAPSPSEVIITMDQVNSMAESAQWAGQVPITQIMTDFSKTVNGTASNSTAA